jgi:antitoxin VapB
MPININNSEADLLTREFAKIAGVGITDAVVIAMKEAIERRRHGETALDAAKRLRTKHGLISQKITRRPLPRKAYDEIWADRKDKASSECT